MTKVTFNTLYKGNKIFQELRDLNPTWWQYCKNENSFYIEIRKNNQINVYFEGGSVIRIHYCSKHKKLQTFTHVKYLGESKGTKYIDCANDINNIIGKIVGNIKLKYSQKKGIEKEKWSEKYIQGQLIIRNKNIHLDSEFAYKDDVSDNRIDLVKCVDGVITFVELKRLDDGRMVTNTENPKIISQMNAYGKFINTYEDDILKYYQLVYDIKNELGLPVPSTRPLSVCKVPELLIFNRWTRMDKHGRRQEHLNKMEAILKRENVKYSIIYEI